MTIKAVIFDLGETLFHYGRADVQGLFLKGARLTYNYLRECTGGEHEIPSFRKYHWRHIFTIKWHYYWSTIRNREFDCLSLLDKKARGMGLQLNREQLHRLAWLWYQPLGAIASLEPNVKDHLRSLGDMSLNLAIISNTFLPASVLDSHLERFGLLPFFPIRTYSSVTVYRKPDPRIYQLTLEQLNVAPSEVVMVGDKLREDIRGPAKVGIRGIFKRGATNHAKKIPAHVPIIDSLGELPDLIRSWDRSAGSTNANSISGVKHTITEYPQDGTSPRTPRCNTPRQKS